MSLHPSRDWKAGGFHQGWCKVDHLDQGVATKAGFVPSRPTDNHRDADSLFIEIWPLLENAVITHHLAMVAHVDDDGVVSLSRVLEGLQHPADLCIHLFDHGVVGRLHPAMIQIAGLGKRRASPTQRGLRINLLIHWLDLEFALAIVWTDRKSVV